MNDVDIAHEHDDERQDDLSTGVDPREDVLEEDSVVRIVVLDMALLVHVRVDGLGCHRLPLLVRV